MNCFCNESSKDYSLHYTIHSIYHARPQPGLPCWVFSRRILGTFQRKLFSCNTRTKLLHQKKFSKLLSSPIVNSQRHFFEDGPGMVQTIRCRAHGLHYSAWRFLKLHFAIIKALRRNLRGKHKRSKVCGGSSPAVKPSAAFLKTL
jgi:hypothetical protein